MTVSLGDDGGQWFRILPKNGYSKILLQFRGEADGYSANNMVVRGSSEFGTADPLAGQGFILEEGDSIVLPGDLPLEVRPGVDAQTGLRVCYLA